MLNDSQSENIKAKILKTALLAGKIMMENGSEVYRVEDTMKRIAQNAGEMDVSCYVTATGIFIGLENQQKVMIAKVLSQQCPLILLDEPTAFLDVTSRLETMLLLHRLAAEQHKTVLLSTHDLDLAIQLADNLWMQAKERPLLCGAPEDLILSGTFGSFFEKTGISFNETTGKLNAETQAIPICVTGDTTVIYWVSNALARNGFCASPTADGDFRIDCRSANELHLTFPDGSETVCPHIVELTRQLRDFFHSRKQKFPRQETEIPSAGKNFSSGKKNKR